MTQEQPPLAYRLLLRIVPHLEIIEKILLVVVTAGVVAKFNFGLDTMNVIQTALVGLSITFFLSAFKPIDIPFQEGDSLRQMELLALIISPKILWISSAISMFGIYVFTQHLAHDGYKRALMIGGSSIALALVLVIVGFATGTKYLRHVIPVLYRAVPLLPVDVYLLYH